MIGSGIQASKSPALHVAEAEALGLHLTYDLFDASVGDFRPEELGDLLNRLQADGYAGVNVTHPFKQSVIPYLNDLSEDVRALGAVNTVVFGAKGRVGHNTDWIGWKRGFTRALPNAKLGQVVQLGAGGAGAAVAYAALDLGVERLLIHDVDAGRVDALRAKLGAKFGDGRLGRVDDIGAAMAGACGLINATPVGMLQYPGVPIDPALLRPDMWVAEVVYVPLDTELLGHARRMGCATVDGGGMVVFQAAEAFHLFTGVAPDADRMTKAFRKLFLAEA